MVTGTGNGDIATGAYHPLIPEKVIPTGITQPREKEAKEIVQ
jgi:hypothetical protein